MTLRSAIIIGAGGHAKVLADTLLAAERRVLGFADPDVTRHSLMLCGLPVLGSDIVLERYSSEETVLVNGIGSIGDRQRDLLRPSVQHRLAARGWHFDNVCHPSTIVSSFARIGPGSQLLAACVLQASVQVGEGCIINTGAIVEHDVVLGDWCHVAPGALVCGGVMIGAHCHIGAGAIIRQGLRLADNTIVGAGAVVVRDCESGVWVGSPARLVEGKA